jgi:Zn-dependent oligopeptidase
MFGRLDASLRFLVHGLLFFGLSAFSNPIFAQTSLESMTPKKIAQAVLLKELREQGFAFELPKIPTTTSDLSERTRTLLARWETMKVKIAENKFRDSHEFVRYVDEFNASLIRELAAYYVLHDLMASKSLKKTINLELNRIWSFLTEEYYGNSEIFRNLRHLEVDFDRLTEVERAVVRDEIVTFRMYHPEFDEDQDEEKTKKTLEEILNVSQTIEKLETEYLRNIDQSTAYLFFTKEDLAGVPEEFLKQLATKAGKFKVEIHQWYHYDLIMRTANRSKTRKEVMRARFDIASEVNSDIFNNILELRQTLADYHDEASYLDWALQWEFFPTSSKLDAFLKAAESGNRKSFLAEKKILQRQKAKRQRRKNTSAKLEAWDVSYEIEQKREEILGKSFSELREFFPLDRVLRGMFDYYEKYFGIRYEEITDMEWWHPSVRAFVMRDKTGRVRGVQVLDPFPRTDKERWFWSLTLQARLKRSTGLTDLPVNLISGNFSPAEPGKPAFVSPGDELATLCHEWGHGINDIATHVDLASISGMRTYDDFVETPSNFFEGLARDPEFLTMVSGHYQTHKSIDRDTAAKISEALEFGSAHARQDKIAKSRIDFALHQKRPRKKSKQERGVVLKSPDEIDRKIRKRLYYAMPSDAFPLSSFSHIATDYGGIFWSYYFGEVSGTQMEAFGKRSPDGTFSAAVGQRLMEKGFTLGGSMKTEDLLRGVFGRNFNACSAALRISTKAKLAGSVKNNRKTAS